MGMIKGLAVLAGIAGAGVLLFARKRSAETGRDIKDVLSNLPEELKGAGEEMKERFDSAADVYKDSSIRKEAEIDEMIAVEEARLEAAQREQTGAGPPVRDV